MKQDIIDDMKKRMKEAFDHMETIMLASMHNLAAEVEHQGETLKGLEQDLAKKNEILESHAKQIDENDKQSDANFYKLEELDVRVEEAQHHAADAVASQDRLERAMRTQTDMVQSMTKRIEYLEKKHCEHLQEREQLERMRLRFQREEDLELLNTLNFTGFNPDMIRGRGATQAARAVLSTIGCEDIISAVKNVKIGTRSVKVTFPDRAATQSAISYLASAMKQIRDSGSHPGLKFATLTPERFNKERDILYRMATEMKRNGELTRFTFTIVKGSLCIKASKPGRRDWIVHVPAPEDLPEEEKCAICYDHFSSRDPLVAYHCGHVFHKACFKEAMATSGKCPQCRSLPSALAIEFLDCGKCKDIINEHQPYDEDLDCIITACGHHHLNICQSKYREELSEFFPINQAGNAEFFRSDTPKCLGCQMEYPMRFQLNTVMHEIAFVPGMTNFIDLEVARDQDRNIPFDAAARVMRQATPRHGSLDRQEARGGGRREASQATGANSEPLGAPRVRASRSFDRNVSRNRRASDSGSRAGRRTRRRHF